MKTLATLQALSWLAVGASGAPLLGGPPPLDASREPSLEPSLERERALTLYHLAMGQELPATRSYNPKTRMRGTKSKTNTVLVDVQVTLFFFAYLYFQLMFYFCWFTGTLREYSQRRSLGESRYTRREPLRGDATFLQKFWYGQTDSGSRAFSAAHHVFLDYLVNPVYETGAAAVRGVPAGVAAAQDAANWCFNTALQLMAIGQRGVLTPSGQLVQVDLSEAHEALAPAVWDAEDTDGVKTAELAPPSMRVRAWSRRAPRRFVTGVHGDDGAFGAEDGVAEDGVATSQPRPLPFKTALVVAGEMSEVLGASRASEALASLQTGDAEADTAALVDGGDTPQRKRRRRLRLIPQPVRNAFRQLLRRGGKTDKPPTPTRLFGIVPAEDGAMPATTITTGADGSIVVEARLGSPVAGQPTLAQLNQGTFM